MKLQKRAAIALVFLSTCSEQAQDRDSTGTEASRAALGTLPASEVATWRKVGASNTPEGRYLQATAVDETRNVLVMFGGLIFDTSTWNRRTSQETWEWNPSTGGWTNRTITGNAPDARSGAAMVFDSKRNKFVMFGGRAGSGYNLEDTWEWDPATGAWTNISSAGTHPSARSQHAMVFEKSTGKIFLFGGGRSDPFSYDGSGISVSMGDAWLLDPETATWSPVSATSPMPSPRHDMGAAWDSARNKVVIFAGMQTEIAGASGVPKQDTWEWDPGEGTWAERTTGGAKPSQRYGHAMAYDDGRGRIMVFGGFDISTGGYLDDLWEWDPGSGTWASRTTRGDSWPTGRMYASLVSIPGNSKMELVAGTSYDVTGWYMGPIGYYELMGSREVWELDTATATFTDRTEPADVPASRGNQSMAYFPETGKVYLFGGYDMWKGQPFDDLWEWDGSRWSLVPTTRRPPARADAGFAYDPARKSLVLFGGTSYFGSTVYNDTWEWTREGGWSQLKPISMPDPLYGHRMVTDTVRKKILLFGGISNQYIYYSPDGGMGPMRDPLRREVWEWDGATLAWTNRTPTTLPQMPAARQYPVMAFDEGRRKLFLFDGPVYSWNTGASTSAFWEWDTETAGWALRDSGDWLDKSYNVVATYDPIRRREILLTDTGMSMGGENETWELDARGPTWYVRAPAGSPSALSNPGMVFDSGRGVAVLFGGINAITGMWMNETWEYSVTGWGNGTGCTSAFAANCASGNCVEGVCCASATCDGPCQSCNVPGSEGTCVPAKPGTEVPGSCENGQACDGTGQCLSSNGLPCTTSSTCASGSCTDGVCCESACSGVCASCNQSGKAGKCSPFAAGTDPENECGKGTGLCRSTCDGIGACAFPGNAQPCASCTVCDGAGTCSVFDPYCSFAGGGGSGGFGGTGGYYTTARGGSGGYYTTSRGGSGGYYTTSRGGSGGYYTTSRGGSGGYYTTAHGGSGGSGAVTITFPGTGGSSTSLGGSGGTITTIPVGSGGSGGFSTTYPGTGGSSTALGGSGGQTSSQGGTGGKRDGGHVGGVDADLGVTSARLHRSGCYCRMGQAPRGDSGMGLPLLGVVLAFWLRVQRRRRRR